MVLRPEEKRRFPRINIHTSIHYRIRGLPQFDSALSDNVSAGGLSFISDRFIPPLTTVMLEINILSRILRPVGRVAWVSPLSHSDRNRFGIEFLEMDPIEKNYLTDYVNMQAVALYK